MVENTQSTEPLDSHPTFRSLQVALKHMSETSYPNVTDEDLMEVMMFSFDLRKTVLENLKKQTLSDVAISLPSGMMAQAITTSALMTYREQFQRVPRDGFHVDALYTASTLEGLFIKITQTEQNDVYHYELVGSIDAISSN